MTDQGRDGLRRKFEALGCSDSEGWAHSEESEDIAQLARFCFLRELWPDLISPWLSGASLNHEVVRAILPDDEARKTLGRFIAGQVYLTLGQVLYHLDEEGEEYRAQGYPGWRLMELGPDGELTGRDVGGLHESLAEGAVAEREIQDVIF